VVTVAQNTVEQVIVSILHECGIRFLAVQQRPVRTERRMIDCLCSLCLCALSTCANGASMSSTRPFDLSVDQVSVFISVTLCHKVKQLRPQDVVTEGFRICVARWSV